MRKIKSPETKPGKRINAPQEISVTDYEHPIFCFRYLHKDYCLNQCTDDEKISLIEQLSRLSGLTWEEIRLAHRHGMGSEKISKDSIKPSKPPNNYGRSRFPFSI
jgi:hypothetical protein